MRRRTDSPELVVPGCQRPTLSAMRDLAAVVAVVWGAVLLVHRLDLPEAVAEWNRAHEQWAVDEVTMVSVVVVAALGMFSWRRWRESLRVIARHEATLKRLASTEGQIAAKDRLINSVSHELRTPLTAILGYAGLLGNDEIDAAQREEMVQRIIKGGWDLAHIVEDLLTRARVEAEALRVVRVPVRLAAQAAQVLEGLNPGDLVRVEFTPSGAVRAMGDPSRVRQIIRNLFSNALRYGGDHIRVEIGSESGWAQLAVSDDGAGIPPDERESVFDPYYRVTSTHDTPGGLGLGLSISRHLARLMGGDLTYRRHNGRTVFELTLPLMADHRGAPNLTSDAGNAGN